MKKFFQTFKIEKNKASIMKWGTIVIVAISLCFGWKYALVSLFSVILTALYSLRAYNEGCFENVTDEHEHIDGGYPEDGWKRLQKNLKIISIILIILGIFLTFFYSLTPIQNACINTSFAGTDYSIPYTLLFPCLIGIILFFILS
ncbi:MAG: hypothetical protein J6Y53_00330 [Alphaproteobacteria bacterium]|nr:hypothetical protein [Alphaproteobacteria bacterium]